MRSPVTVATTRSRSWSTVGRVSAALLVDGARPRSARGRPSGDRRDAQVLHGQQGHGAVRRRGVRRWSPMRLQSQFNFLRLQREWAAASDILRYRLPHRFGGAYADTDVTCTGRVRRRDVKAHPFHPDHRFAIESMAIRHRRRPLCSAPPATRSSTRSLTFVAEAYSPTTAAVLRTPRSRGRRPRSTRKLGAASTRLWLEPARPRSPWLCSGTASGPNPWAIRREYKTCSPTPSSPTRTPSCRPKRSTAFTPVRFSETSSGDEARGPEEVSKPDPDGGCRRRPPQNPSTDDDIQAAREFFADVAIGRNVLDIRRRPVGLAATDPVDVAPMTPRSAPTTCCSASPTTHPSSTSSRTRTWAPAAGPWSSGSTLSRWGSSMWSIESDMALIDNGRCRRGDVRQRSRTAATGRSTRTALHRPRLRRAGEPTDDFLALRPRPSSRVTRPPTPRDRLRPRR